MNYLEEVGHFIAKDGEKINVSVTMYSHDDSLALISIDSDGYPYANITVNLCGYGRYPEDGFIFVDHNFYGNGDNHDYNEFIDKFTDKTFPPEKIEFGYATSVKVKLNKDIIKKYNKLKDSI